MLVCVCLLFLGLGLPEQVSAAASQVFKATGGPQIYVVPPWITTIDVIVRGASGSNGTIGGRTVLGGKGAEVRAKLSVRPGEALQVVVGLSGGYNGGGWGGMPGGGASDIRRPAFSTSSSCVVDMSCGLATRVLVAGGGGGAGITRDDTGQLLPGGFLPHGGDGGLKGWPGAYKNVSTTVNGNVVNGNVGPGQGGTQTAGGASGQGTQTGGYRIAASGGLGGGGIGGFLPGSSGGGGGGGYYGGGAGGLADALVNPILVLGVGGGGGGSSYLGTTQLGVLSATCLDGVITGDGEVIISPPSAIASSVFLANNQPQYYQVPANVSSLYFRLYGGGFGGAGDVLFGTLPVTPFMWIQVNVGGRGYGCCDPDVLDGKAIAFSGGWNGGGWSFSPGFANAGGGGGGGTDLRMCQTLPTLPCNLSERLLVAGGGGGGGVGMYGCVGGPGGHSASGAAGGPYQCQPAGNIPANLTSGGVATGEAASYSGGFGFGGNTTSGGAGGGGWYGGYAVAGGFGGGGGGSSYASATGRPGGAHRLDVANGNPLWTRHTQGAGGSAGDGMVLLLAQPYGITGAARSITYTSVTLYGYANPRFLASSVYVLCGTDSAAVQAGSATRTNMVLATLPSITVNDNNPLAGDGLTFVRVGLTGLSSNTTYYYRVCAQSAAGLGCGRTLSFRTLVAMAPVFTAEGNDECPQVNVAYSAYYAAESNAVLSLSGSLPTGLTFNPSTGYITGTATVYQEEVSFSVVATNATGVTETGLMDCTVDVPVPSPSATSTASVTATATSSATASSSATSSASSTATRSATATASRTATASATASATGSTSASATATSSSTSSASATASSSATATITSSSSATASATATSTVTATASASGTATASPTQTASATPCANLPVSFPLRTAGVDLPVVAGSTGHVCAIFNGAISCVGDNTYGQLGNGGTTAVAKPAGETLPAPTTFVDLGGVAAASVGIGDAFTCALRVDGTVACWGKCDARCGYASVGNVLSPGNLTVRLGAPAVQISVGKAHVCALLATARVRCWGGNREGELGREHTSDIGDDEHPDADDPVDLGGCVDQLSDTAWTHTCARVDGSAHVCFGERMGALGRPELSTLSSYRRPGAYEPIDFPYPVVKLTVGPFVTCALYEGNTSFSCFGVDGGGVDGGSATIGTHVNTPGVAPLHTVQLPDGETILDVRPSSTATCVLLSSGRVNCYGTSTNNLLPTSLPWSDLTLLPESAVDVSGSSAQLSLQIAGACVVRRSNAGIMCWGIVPGTSRVSGVREEPWLESYLFPPTGKAASRDSSTFTADIVTVGRRFTCVLQYTSTTGAVTCTGLNSAGQMAVATTMPSFSFQPARIGTPLVFIDAGFEHMCGITASRRVLCWGECSQSQCGLPSAVQAVGDDEEVANTPVLNFTALHSSTNRVALSLSAGAAHTCVIFASSVTAPYGNNVSCFGSGANYRLGTADEDTRTATAAVPVQLPPGVNITQVSAGFDHTCAVSTLGRVYCWGGNEHMQSSASLSPSVQASSALEPLSLPAAAVKVAAGTYITCVLLVGDIAMCFGSNLNGTLGYGFTSAQLPPANGLPPLDLGGPVKDIDVSDGLICAVLWGGRSTCWSGSIPALPAFPAPSITRTIGDDEVPSGNYLNLNLRPDYIVVATDHACAVGRGGRLLCFGKGTDGALGTGNYDDGDAPETLPFVALLPEILPTPSPSPSVGAPRPPPSSSPSPSPRARAIKLALGVQGGGGDLFIDNVAGIADLLREAIAELAAVEPGRVVLAAVTDSDDTVRLNSTSPANNGTLNNQTFAYQTANNRRARLLLAQQTDVSSLPACAAVRNSSQALNASKVTVQMAIDLSGVAILQSGEDPAVLIVQRLRQLMSLNSSVAATAFADFAILWSNCTGSPADLSELLSLVFLPTVVYGPGLPAVLSPDGLSEGEVAVAVILPLLACCCCIIVACIVRRRRKEKEKKQPANVVQSMAPEIVAAEEGSFQGANPMHKRVASEQAAAASAAASADFTDDGGKNRRLTPSVVSGKSHAPTAPAPAPVPVSASSGSVDVVAIADIHPITSESDAAAGKRRRFKPLVILSESETAGAPAAPKVPDTA